MVISNESKTQRKLAVLRRKEEEESVKILAGKYALPYADLSLFPIETDALLILPESEARKGELVIFQQTGKKISVGVKNPEKSETKAFLAKLAEKGYHSTLFLVSLSSLGHAWNFYAHAKHREQFVSGAIQVSSEKIEKLRASLRDIKEIQKQIEEAFREKTTEILELIIAGSLAADASDIHFEPEKEATRLRYRLDGVLHTMSSSLPQRLYKLLMSRIKLVSDLKLNIHGRAQDGRFTIKTAEGDIEVRVSVLPGPDGENIVMRILNPRSIQITLEELGMQPWIKKTMLEELDKPNGMILTTGPTGSGKTTTLYAFLKKVHTSEIKIITIEDPIEYHILGVEQTQVEPEKGYSFENGLRSIVRQDPDVILVGEIRDFETAEVAMHAALTGHLVFSTLHTNDAAGTIPRLLDLGVKPAIIAPAINVSMAQRLLRKLCMFCRIEGFSVPEEKEKIEKELKLLPSSVTAPLQSAWKPYHAKEEGCRECNGTGYKGRVGVFEIILITAKIEQLIIKEPSEFEIKKEAQEQGQITMRQDGLLKIVAGITDSAELERVVGV